MRGARGRVPLRTEPRDSERGPVGKLRGVTGGPGGRLALGLCSGANRSVAGAVVPL